MIILNISDCCLIKILKHISLFTGKNFISEFGKQNWFCKKIFDNKH